MNISGYISRKLDCPDKEASKAVANFLHSNLGKSGVPKCMILPKRRYNILNKSKLEN
jgi:hypothetical protein